MAFSVKVTRKVSIPDPIRVARYARAPELGPRILFFSGGSALSGLSRELARYTHNSIHLVTPFDSGGSSAALRKAFHMPAVGDVRNRLMALADQSALGAPEVYKLFARRMPKDSDNNALFTTLERLIAGHDPMVAAINDPMRKIIRNHLGYFRSVMPDGFDLKGASVGNLILTGGYLNNGRHLDPVIFLFSRLVEARGVVRPTVNKSRHLAVELENGDVIVGQHLFTGKENGPILFPIRNMYTTRNLASEEPVDVGIRRKTEEMIGQAELICYPMGSFYSSVVANLLPSGVGRCVTMNECPKVYIPNSGHDPEQVGMTVGDCVETLVKYLARSGGGKIDRLLNYVVVDTVNGSYPWPLELEHVREMGITVIDTPLISEQSGPYYDEKLLLPVLLSLT
ncbi:MAG: GAK system CofD-like protein [Nitrospinae bacterium]|nr:GAK system CofD-like protein [Nitrospinota bacterium]